ncbi:MAG TPA: bifunctional riboflavin kinase/FAD synthetase [Verrucomicrobiae bacterium]|nr:bifunctional riboflavin kinase/FAD synthetase [Verrucomicrobiae bacterium]
MRILSLASELSPGHRKVCAAIGVFDGVHLGHQQVLRQTISDSRQHDALAVAITFDKHPNAVVAPERVPPLIYPLSQKLRVIGELGFDAALVIPFNKEFSQLTGEQFVRGLARDFGQIHSLCVGSTFTFGYKRGGNVSLLRELGKELKFVAHGLAALALDGEVVSSTRIREAIHAGDLEAASQMLGRTYSFSGHVLKGDGIGRQLGFPTANVDVTGLVLPPQGVFAARAITKGRAYRAAVNIGVRPTLAQPQPGLRVEAHLLDFAGDLYGQELELVFVARLRGEMKFASLADLSAQIARDVALAREIF